MSPFLDSGPAGPHPRPALLPGSTSPNGRLRETTRAVRRSGRRTMIEEGEQVFALSGTATLDPSAPAILDNPVYLEKYEQGIPSIGMTPETVSAEYSQPIRVEPRSFRSW